MKRLTILPVLSVLVLLASCKGGGAPRIDLAEFDKLRNDGPVIIVDVRSRLEYEAGHLPGAISMPIDQLEGRAAELKTMRGKIVTYCSCPAEETSLAATATLSRLGIKGAQALVGGFPTWVAAGRRVITGPAPL